MVEPALFGANAEALAEPNERAQEIRFSGGAAQARVKQPRREMSLEAKEAMLKEVRRR